MKRAFRSILHLPSSLLALGLVLLLTCPAHAFILRMGAQVPVNFTPPGWLATNQLAVISQGNGTTAGGSNYMTSMGMCMDTGGAGNSWYGNWGTNLAFGGAATNCNYGVMEMIVMPVSEYDTAAGDHFGGAINHLDGSHWSNLVLMEPNGAAASSTNGQGTIYIGDRAGGSEVKTSYFIAPGHSIANFHLYDLLISQTNYGTATCRVDVFEYDLFTGRGFQLMTNQAHTPIAGAPTNGNQSGHAFGGVGCVFALHSTDSNATTIVPLGPVLGSLYTSAGVSGGFTSNGVPIIDAAAGHGGVSTYTFFAPPIIRGDFTETGNVTLISGRGCGWGMLGYYFIWYDGNNNEFRLFDGLSSPAAISASSSVTLTTGTQYAYTRSVRGTNYTLTCNGVTFSAHDNTYTGTGAVFYQAFQGLGKFENVIIGR